VPQIALDVIRSSASVAASNFASATVSIETSR
jgi:hypothetical protein